MQQSAPPPAAGDEQRHISPWAIMSLLTATFFLCPLSTAVAPVLGLKALSEARSNPAIGGRRIAKLGITLGLVLTGAWIGAAVWWHFNARVPMKRGPVEALRAGSSGDVPGFIDAFYYAGDAPTELEAARFLNELSGRYGRFVDARLSVDAPVPDQPVGEGLRKRIPYLLVFERRTVPAVAEFVVFAEDEAGLQLKFSSLEVLDDDEGDFMYPASLQRPEVGADGPGDTTANTDSAGPSDSAP